MYRFLALMMLSCVAACGGDGGSGKVETAPLSLSDVTPAKGATGVQRTTIVVLTRSDPQIACDAAGNALALWRHLGTGATSEIRSGRYTVSGGWAASINAGSTADVLDPVVAIDSAGNALAVWQQIDSSNVSALWANRFE